MTATADAHGPCWTTRRANIIPPPRRPDVLQEVLDGGAVLVDPRTEDVHCLNETALRVWLVCDGQTTTKRMALLLAQDHEVDLDQALDCVDQLVAFFASLGLFEEQVDGITKGDQCIPSRET